MVKQVFAFQTKAELSKAVCHLINKGLVCNTYTKQGLFFVEVCK